jgi:DNA-binding GntR family transcriptional regulator
VARRGEAKTLAADVYAQIREAIFVGALSPGDRLQPALLSDRYQASTTVVREALALLVGERLVTSRPGHGYFIPEIQRDEIIDVTAVRCHVETMALRLAMQRGDLEWESAMIAAHHRLVRTPRRTPENPNHLNQDWARAHEAFHLQLLAACGVPVLLDMCRQLTSATELFRVWVGPYSTTVKRDVEAEHEAILQSVLGGDEDEACALLSTHYRTSAQLIVTHWPEPVVSAPAGTPAAENEGPA